MAERAQIEMTLADKASAVLNQFKTNLVTTGNVGVKAIKSIGSAFSSIKTGISYIGSGLKTAFETAMKPISLVGDGIGWICDKLKWIALAGVGYITLATKAHIEEDNALQKMKQTMTALGLEADKNSKKFFDFANAFEETYGTADETIMNMVQKALMTGTSLSNVKNTVSKSVVLSRQSPAFRQSQNQNMAYVDKMATTGLSMQKGYMDNSTGGKLEKMKIAIDGLNKSIGGVFAPLVGKAADAISKFVDDNTSKIVTFAKTGVAYMTFAGKSIYNFFASGDSWSQKWSVFWNALVEITKTSVSAMVDIASQAGKMIMEKIFFDDDSVGGFIKNTVKNLGAAFTFDKSAMTGARPWAQNLMQGWNDMLLPDDTPSYMKQKTGMAQYQANMGNILKGTGAHIQGIMADVNKNLPGFGNLQAANSQDLQNSLAKIQAESQQQDTKQNNVLEERTRKLRQHIDLKRELLNLSKSTLDTLLTMRGAEALQTESLMSAYKNGTNVSQLSSNQVQFITGNSALKEIWGGELEKYVKEKYGIKDKQAGEEGEQKTIIEMNPEASEIFRIAKQTNKRMLNQQGIKY
jgi:hypothetical protein